MTMMVFPDVSGIEEQKRRIGSTAADSLCEPGNQNIARPHMISLSHQQELRSYTSYIEVPSLLLSYQITATIN